MSLPLTPCLITIGKMYFSPPKSINSSITLFSDYLSREPKELAIALRAETELSVLAFKNCSIISFPFIL